MKLPVALSLGIHGAVLAAMSRLDALPPPRPSSVVAMEVHQRVREPPPPPPPPPVIPPPEVVPKKVKVRTVATIVKEAPPPPPVEPPPPPLAFAVDMASTVEGGGGVAVPVVEGGGNMFADPAEAGLPKGKATSPPPAPSGQGKGGRGRYEITEEPKFLTPESERTPPYPRAARALEIEGKVLLRVYVDELGRVGEVKVLEPLGGGCTEVAVKWAKTKWRFAPAKAGSEAVGMWISVPVRFVLER
jgi:protein TonB